MAKERIWIVTSIVIIILVSGALVYILYGTNKVDEAQVNEARLNLPECNYYKSKVQKDRVYTEEELKQAEDCNKAIIKYLKENETSQ